MPGILSPRPRRLFSARTYALTVCASRSLQQIAGGVASVIAGWVIVQQPGGRLLHFDTLGYMCIGLMVACGFCMYLINGQILRKVYAKHETHEPKIEMVA